MIELLIGGAALAAGGAAEAIRRRRDRRHHAEIVQRHQTAMRIDRIRRDAEDDMLRSTRDYIDGVVIDDD